MDHVLAAVLIGLLVGLVVGALGAGGGILSVPILVYALDQTPHSAAASSLVIVGCTAAAGLVHHLRNRTIDWAGGLSFGALGVGGTFIGSRLSVRVPEQLLMTLFAVLLALVATAMFIKARSDRRTPAGSPDATPPPAAGLGRSVSRWLRIVLLATFTGLLTGFFGVGGGFIVVPVLVLALGLPIRTAAGTSMVVMLIAAASGLVARIGTEVVIDWPLTLAFAAASMVGGLLGGPVTTRARSWQLTLVFAILLTAVALLIGVELALQL